MTQVMKPQAPPDAAAMQHVLQLGTGYIVSAALGAAVRLDIPGQLTAGQRTAADLARAVGAHEDALYRVLSALAMVGVFTETAPRTFALTPTGDLLRPGAPGGLREMMLWMCDAFHFRVYAEMLHAVRTGETVGEKVTGVPVFEHFAREAELSARFNDAMTAFSANVAPAAVEAYDFSDIGTLADIAGGHGMVLATVLRKHPHMRGILFDLEHVLAGNRLAEFGVKDRVQLASGDFFTAVPAGADAYLMKHIIHDWDDEKSITILKNVKTALQGKPDGKVILLETIIRPGNEPDLGKVIDLEMLLLPGGKERTEEEFAALLERAGFRLTRVVATASPLSVIEARPQ